MQNIKAILFDFAGVVVSEGFQAWVAQHVDFSKTSRDQLNDMDLKMDLASIPLSEHYAYLAKISGGNPATLQKEIIAEYSINQPLHDTIKEVHEKGIKTAIISNFPKEWFWEIFHKFHLEDIFDNIIVSAEVKLLKPDPRIYNEALKRLNVLPEEALFVDDREQMVDGARQVGIHSIVFVSAEDFKSKLVDYGILL